MSAENGQSQPYVVEFLGTAEDQFRAILRAAGELGAGRPILDAVATAVARLRVRPREFGDPLYSLRKMRMRVYQGVVPPLCLGYAVHDVARLVVVRRVVWLAAPPG